MAGRVSDDEFAPVRREIAIGDVDGDALLALRREPVHQEGEVDRLIRRAMAARGSFDGAELVLENRVGLVQETTDQGRFAGRDGRRIRPCKIFARAS
jgi:hypothetical protein